MSNDDVGKFVASNIVKMNDFNTIAKNLCNEALILGSTDNVTVLVIDLR
jgi:serine/threonine protein phosphatase PrpC